MATSGFKDHFSVLASAYVNYRPDYPAAMFEFLASLVSSADVAWDCATGSGQCATGLVNYFDRVIATDASGDQISLAMAHDKINYRIATAENSGLEAHQIDLVSVAQAIHWFDREAFYAEVGRVLKPGGVIAVWAYGLFSVSPAIDGIVNDFYHRILADHWPAERRLIENHYRDVHLPFPALPAPDFKMKRQWDCHQLLGYLGTWSAVQKYREQYNADPLELIREAVQKAWGQTEEKKEVTWPLILKLARKPRQDVTSNE